MKRVLSTSAGVASVAILVLASIALGSTGGKQAAAAKSPITIRERGSAQENADFMLKGRFILALSGVIEDSGKTSIRPANVTNRTVGGQLQERVSGNNTLTSKKGILTFSFRGIGIVVRNVNATKPPYFAEYGTWKITGGSGIYKGWKGGGPWGNVGTPGANNIEWDGFVTH